MRHAVGEIPPCDGLNEGLAETYSVELFNPVGLGLLIPWHVPMSHGLNVDSIFL